MSILSRKSALGCGAAIIALAIASGAWAQQRSFNIPAQDATQAIPEFARQAGLQIIAPGGQLRGVRTRAVSGEHDARAALSALLQGTGLVVASDTGGIITLRRDATGPQSDAGDAPQGAAAQVEDIVVTGSRIRGAPPSAPVVTVTTEDMRNAGQSDLGEAWSAPFEVVHPLCWSEDRNGWSRAWPGSVPNPKRSSPSCVRLTC